MRLGFIASVKRTVFEAGMDLARRLGHWDVFRTQYLCKSKSIVIGARRYLIPDTY